jgi:hypothetical protein
MSHYTCISYRVMFRCPLICVEKQIEQICIVHLLQFYALQILTNFGTGFMMRFSAASVGGRLLVFI